MTAPRFVALDTPDGPRWVNPAHVEFIGAYSGRPGLTTVRMVSGYVVDCAMRPPDILAKLRDN